MSGLDYFGTQKASVKGFCDYCKKNIPLVITVTIALFFTYGGKLFWYSIGIDTELFINDKNYFLPWNIQIGRFGLGVLQKLWHIKEFNPFTAFLIAFCFIWLFPLSWCYIIGVFSRNTGRNNNLIPFALIGRHQSSAVFKTNFLPGEVLGHSFFEWGATQSIEASNRGLPFMKSLGMNYPTPDESQMDEARKAAESMPSWPNPACIRRLPDVIVVKLSDSAYIPPEKRF
jgi:hypothetical protein